MSCYPPSRSVALHYRITIMTVLLLFKVIPINDTRQVLIHFGNKPFPIWSSLSFSHIVLMFIAPLPHLEIRWFGHIRFSTFYSLSNKVLDDNYSTFGNSIAGVSLPLLL